MSRSFFSLSDARNLSGFVAHDLSDPLSTLAWGSLFAGVNVGLCCGAKVRGSGVDPYRPGEKEFLSQTPRHDPENVTGVGMSLSLWESYL